ncbi:MAG: NAD(P)-dependent alcohol dehydrogenase [Eudoraea sp.]
MKAFLQETYGSVQNLKLTNIPKSIPKENEVLIKIYATSINDYDWSMIRGKPYIYRLMYGIFKPKNKVLGMELSGIIEQIGEKVSNFKIGDEVYGDISNYGFGSFAEYLCIDEKAVLPKPSNLSFEEATALPHAGGLALQGLLDVGKLTPGKKVLINGAGGGMGILAVQIAINEEAEVTGVDSAEKLEGMKPYGFKEVIDYKSTDFTKQGILYDLILDAKTNRSPFKYLKVLEPNGSYVTVGGSLLRLLQILFLKRWISLFHKKHFEIVALKPNKDMNILEKLVEEGKLKTALDGPFMLEQIPVAIKRFGEGKHLGKVVISVAQ